MLKIDVFQEALRAGEIKELPGVTSVGGYPLFYLGLGKKTPDLYRRGMNCLPEI